MMTNVFFIDTSDTPQAPRDSEFEGIIEEKIDLSLSRTQDCSGYFLLQLFSGLV